MRRSGGRRPPEPRRPRDGTPRRALVAALVAAALLAPGRGALADDPAVNIAVRDQVRAALGPMRDSEADYAMGGYVPGEGAMFNLVLVRGPNSVPGQPAFAGVRDWATYLLNTFGSQLTAMPENERVALTVEYYDYADDSYHTLVLSTARADIGNPLALRCWVDGVRCEGGEATVDPQEMPPYPATSAASPAASTAMPAPLISTPSAGGSFSDAEAVQAVWLPVSGTWETVSGRYVQRELGKFDLISFYRNPVVGNVTFGADVTYLEGDMGAGLVFLAPSRERKNGAQMISFTANGSYLQWGMFDDAGDFKFAGGANLAAPVSDGKPHRLAVNLAGPAYSVLLDGKVIAADIPVQNGRTDGYVGLFVNTSAVAFDNVTLEAALT